MHYMVRTHRTYSAVQQNFAPHHIKNMPLLKLLLNFLSNDRHTGVHVRGDIKPPDSTGHTCVLQLIAAG